jgi:hypothetical protein
MPLRNDILEVLVTLRSVQRVRQIVHDRDIVRYENPITDSDLCTGPHLRIFAKIAISAHPNRSTMREQ